MKPITHLSVSHHLIQLFRTLQSAGKKQHPRCEAIQTVDSVKFRETSLLPQDEDDRVVPISSTGVHRQRGRFVHHDHVIVLFNDLNRTTDHRWLVAMDCVPHQVIVLGKINIS